MGSSLDVVVLPRALLCFQLGITLAPFIILSFLVLGLWGYVSWADPADDGGCALRKKGADTPHYCSSCRKSVKGFDHHCSW